MKLIRIVTLLAALAAVGSGALLAHAANVDISMNVFPTIAGSPNTGGTWTLVAKTDSPHGIAAISFWLLRISTVGIVAESDIGQDGNPYFGTFGGIYNLVYFQNPTLPASVVLGVGTPAKSDGPDPLGNPLWDGATRLISGSYPSLIPAFSTTPGNITGANTLPSSAPPYNGSLAATVSTVVRVIPEPGSLALTLTCALGIINARRRPK